MVTVAGREIVPPPEAPSSFDSALSNVQLVTLLKGRDIGEKDAAV